MSRIRTIKPEFFRHEELFEAEKATGLPLRIAYAGLWTVADREGRFRWKPRVLVLDVLPFDDVNFAEVLDALATRGFLIKYQVGADTFGCIPSFKDHQHVNVREPASHIPGPDEAGARTCANIPAHGEGKGREGEMNTVGSARAEPHPATAGDERVHSEELKPKGQTYPQEFDELWNDYRGVCDAASAEPGSKKNAFERWRKLSAEDRQRCFDGVMAYTVWRIDRAEKPGVFTAQPKHFERFISGRLWETYQTEAA